MADSTHDITIDKGATFTMRAIWMDSAGALMNLTQFSARMQIRKSHKDETVMVSLTSDPAGGIVLGGAAGTVDITITDETTSAIQGARGVYDIELISFDGVVTRLLEGAVEFTPEVTR